MGVKLVGDWDNFDKNVKKLGKPDFRPLLAAIGEVVIAETVRRFAREEDSTGKKWKRLEDSTLKRRRTRKDKPNKKTIILSDTEVLRNSITRVVDRFKVEIGSNLPYAGVHQTGSKKKNIPARPYLPKKGIASKRERDSINATIIEFMDGG